MPCMTTTYQSGCTTSAGTSCRTEASPTQIATARVVGVTSNPTIFMQAIEDSNAYDRDLADLARRQVSRDEAARAPTAADIRSASDAFSTVFAASAGRDGRVSIEKG